MRVCACIYIYIYIYSGLNMAVYYIHTYMTVPTYFIQAEDSLT